MIAKNIDDNDKFKDNLLLYLEEIAKYCKGNGHF